jgi:hypothetical protein
LLVSFHCFILFLGESVENLLQNYKKIETDNVSGCKVAEELYILVNKTKNRRDEISCTTKQVLLIADFEDYYSIEKFTKITNSFYTHFCFI